MLHIINKSHQLRLFSDIRSWLSFIISTGLYSAENVWAITVTGEEV